MSQGTHRRAIRFCHRKMGLFSAMLKTAADAVSPPQMAGGGPCDLAGEWLPCRHDEWRNLNLGSHKARARAPTTKVTYDSNGRGHGWVGEYNLQYSVTTVAPGHYTATARIPLLLWSASDGNLTLLHDGTLHVEYPSNGIVEYWRRADGRGAEIRQIASAAVVSAPSRPSRPLKLVIRHFGPGSVFGSSTDLGWHWGLAVGEHDDCYEVAGSMVVIGPKGPVAASSPLAINTKPTHLSQFDAYLTLPQTTQKTDNEVEEFARLWVRKHPVYQALGPNCQTFAEDMFTFLTAQNLPFPKGASRIRTYGKGDGPEHHRSTVWIHPAKKP